MRCAVGVAWHTVQQCLLVAGFWLEQAAGLGVQVVADRVKAVGVRLASLRNLCPVLPGIVLGLRRSVNGLLVRGMRVVVLQILLRLLVRISRRLGSS